MTMDDADKMLEWKNYEETKQYSIVSWGEDIMWDDHIEYLKDNIQFFQIAETIVEDKTVRVGAVRVKDNEISIWIDRAFRNIGMAKMIINRVAVSGMTATIVEGNIASMRAFIQSGFLPIEHDITGGKNKNDNYYYTFKKQ